MVKDLKDSSEGKTSQTIDAAKFIIWTEIRPLVFIVYNWRAAVIFITFVAISVLGGYTLDKIWHLNWLTALFCVTSALIGIAIAATKIRPESMFVDPSKRIELGDEMLVKLLNENKENSQ